MRIVIEGPPIPAARPRVCRIGGTSVAYDPQKRQKQDIQKEILHQLSSMPQFRSEKAQADAFDVKMSFHLPISKSATKAQKNEKLWGIAETQRPDCSNLAKFYEDCMNGIVYKDDSMIESLSVSKKFSETPCTIIDVVPKRRKDLPETTRFIMKNVSPEELIQLANDFIELKGIDSLLFSSSKEGIKPDFVSFIPALEAYIQKHKDTFKTFLKMDTKK